ncbi:uncharacterized protein BO97DRAFT_403745 [Aspergillus homomorphus CBS 101889]|uniref:Transcription factor hoxa13 n=1 Tax=Aspergillus homomorphus (strain CBS 101889) TaxID=1450537 RepID=A0A395I7S5_ASPHC|nr:hypothetical protein BO97DRAFT_403745 [Aspergillus homomorphus CBS 101889]RAL15118.1 hypothetical protein BO97DRAFT_403745 [Aspergillus homomorphus CBS 101889]
MATTKNGFVVEGATRPAATTDNIPKQRKRDTLRWTVGLVVRLCIWYALLTPFLRCPPQLSDLDGASPRVCKPYLIVRSHVEPHITPYYNAYGAPYVEKARPYVHIVNEKVYTPTSRVIRRGYEKYGVPALDRAQLYGQEQWEAQVVPHLDAVKDQTNALYRSEIYPYVQRVEEAVLPSYRKASGAVRSACVDYILPFGAKYRPFIGKTYTSGQDILTTTVLPNVRSSWSTAIQFIKGTLWPKIAGLYWENVEPQLVKIGERLASYREGKGPRNVVDEANASLPDQQVHASSSLGTTSLGTTQYETVTTSSRTEAPSPQLTLSVEEQTAHRRERVESDLHVWQEKFAVAAENGLESLEEHLQEIVKDYMSSETLAYGEELITGLGAVVDNEIIALKHHINTLAESLPYEDLPKAEKAAQEELLRNVKEAAISIRGRAHVLREWRNSFEAELMRRVHAAVNSTLEVLDNVRDLGFQEVGIRWASMDGVTYKDWARYHALKAEMEDWKEQFVAFGTQHAKLEEAISVAEDTLSRGMDIAENAAKELARLREVGKWKISAREASDNFDTRSEDPPSLPQPAIPEEDTADEIDEPQTGAECLENDTSPLISAEDEDIQKSAFQANGNTDAFVEFAADNQGDPVAASGDTGSADASDQAAWGVAAAVLSAQKAKDGRLGSDEQEAIERLISGLLVDKDAEFVQDIMNQLRAIYKTPRPSSASPSTSSLAPSSAAPTASTSVADDTMIMATATTAAETTPSAPAESEEIVSESSAAPAVSDVPDLVPEEQRTSEGLEDVEEALESAESQYASLTSRASDFEPAAVETGVDDLDEQTESMEDDIEEEL